jgi:hypothetical protein
VYTSEQYERLASLFGARLCRLMRCDAIMHVHACMRGLTLRHCLFFPKSGIWPTPRGGSGGVTLLRDGVAGVSYVLADARRCEALPEALRLRAAPGLRHTRAPRGATCKAACADAGAVCDATQFWCAPPRTRACMHALPASERLVLAQFRFVNQCAALRAAFGCEAGCALVTGADVPCYNVDDSSAAFRQCLVTETRSRCDARHRATERLCPCVPAAANATRAVTAAALPRPEQ